VENPRRYIALFREMLDWSEADIEALIRRIQAGHNGAAERTPGIVNL